MRCNLNFNQCYAGPYYPSPIYTCANQLLGLLSPSTVTIINPIISNFAFYNSTTPQVVSAGGSVLLNYVSGFGNSSSSAGSISLGEGNYQITYNASGVIPAGGSFSLGIAQDGAIILDSISTMSGVVGSQVNISDSTIITVPPTGSTINLVNILAESETVNTANLLITRIA